MNAYSGSPSRLPINMIQNPYTYSLNPQHSSSMQPYNFHEVSQPNSPGRPRGTERGGEGPNLTQNLNLADNNSFGRNFKTRLYGADPNEQAAKQQKLQRYREQLLLQAEENKRRKQQEKAKADAQDQKLERQFYENIKIEAQKKALKKEEPSYFMMRTIKGDRKRLNKSANLSDSRGVQVKQNNYLSAQKKFADQFSPKDNLKRTLYENNIMRRGGYHNKSSLDPIISNPQEKQQKQTPKAQKNQSPKQPLKSRREENEGIEEEAKYQEQRINQILIFQQHMLKKLDYFKKDVIHASKSLQLQDQLEKIKLKIRAKPLNMEKIHSLNPREGIDNMMDHSAFYHLPIINPYRQKVYEGSRQIKKRRDKEHSQQMKSEQPQPQQEQKQVIKLEDKKKFEVYNDKNISQRNSDFGIQANNQEQ